MCSKMKIGLNKKLRKRFLVDYFDDRVVLLDLNTFEVHYATCTRDALYLMLIQTNDKESLKKIIKKKNWTASHLRRNGKQI
jgi:hypothetical protein